MLRLLMRHEEKEREERQIVAWKREKLKPLR